MRRGTAIFIFIGLFFVCAISGVGYFLSLENTRTSERSDVPIVLGVLPEGVSVIEKEGNRILRDERVGYEMEIPDDTRLKTEGSRILLYSSESDVPVLGGINIFKSNNNLSLEEWVEALHQEIGFLYYDEREKITINEVEVIKIKVEGEIETFEYYFKKDNAIVGISLPAHTDFNHYIQSIRILR